MGGLGYAARPRETDGGAQGRIGDVTEACGSRLGRTSYMSARLSSPSVLSNSLTSRRDGNET